MKKLHYIYTILLVLFVTSAYAKDKRYIIENVKVEALAENAAKAKDLAMHEGERQALNLLFDNLEISRINTQFIDDEVLAQILESIQIKNEVLSDVKYSGLVTISFNKDFVNFNLEKLGIGKNKTLEPKYLYIPVLKKDNEYHILANNIWREKILEQFNNVRLNNMVMLDANPLNEIIFDNIDTQNIKYNEFVEVLDAHKANILLFAICEYIPEYKNIQITFRKISPADSEETQVTIFNENNLEYEDFMSLAVAKNLNYLSKYFKPLANIQEMEKEKDEFIVYTVYNGLEEYLFLKNILGNLNFIKKVQLDYLTLTEARFRLQINVDLNKVFGLFKQNGLLLHFKNNQYYLIYVGLRE